MKRPLMTPLRVDQRRETIDLSGPERVGHLLRKPAHVAQRVEHARLALSIRADDRLDRLAGDSALSGVHDDAPLFELGPRPCAEREASDIDVTGREAQPEPPPKAAA